MANTVLVLKLGIFWTKLASHRYIQQIDRPLTCKKKFRLIFNMFNPFFKLILMLNELLNLTLFSSPKSKIQLNY